MARAKAVLVDGLGITNISPVRAIRLVGRVNKPGVVKVQLGSKMDKVRVLQSKKELTKSPQFKKVYIQSALSHEEQIMRVNFQTLLQELPNGRDFRLLGNGRLAKRENDGQNNSSRNTRARQGSS